MAKEKIKEENFVKIVNMGNRYPTINLEIFKSMKPYFNNDGYWVNVSTDKENIYKIDETFFDINIPYEVIAIVRHPNEPINVMLIETFGGDAVLAIGEEGLEKVKRSQAKTTIETTDVQSQVFKILNTNDKDRIEQIEDLFTDNGVFKEFKLNFGNDASFLLEDILDLLVDAEKNTKKKPTKKKKKESIVTKVGEKVEIKPKKKTKKQIKEDEDFASLLLELDNTDITTTVDADTNFEDLLDSI